MSSALSFNKNFATIDRGGTLETEVHFSRRRGAGVGRRRYLHSLSLKCISYVRAVETALSAHLNAVCVGSYCIDGAHLDSLDHVLTETKKKHTRTGEVSTTNVHVKETDKARASIANTYRRRVVERRLH